MKAIVALTLLAAGATIAGCTGVVHTQLRATPNPTSLGPEAAVRTPDLSSADALARSLALRAASNPGVGGPHGAPLRYRAIQYSVSVSNAGTSVAYTAFVTVTRTITVQASSAARIETFNDGPPTFPSAVDQTRWKADGSPPLSPVPSTGESTSLPPGHFSFLSQGDSLTYAQATQLPTTPDALATQLTSHLQRLAGAHPPTTLVLEQLAYLIATAPVGKGTSSAAWSLVASLPGLYLCGPGTDFAARHGQGVCADSGGYETEILVEPKTGAILAIEDRLLERSDLYPHVPDHSLIASDTLLTASNQ